MITLLILAILGGIFKLPLNADYAVIVIVLCLICDAVWINTLGK